MANGWHGDDFLEINKETLEKIVNHSSDEIFVLDADKRIVFVNQKCEEHYGVKPGDVVGKTMLSLLRKGIGLPLSLTSCLKKATHYHTTIHIY